MRLIDADLLAKTIERAQMESWKCSALSIVHDAPTVPNEYMRGYEAAEREYKRPTGKWIPVKYRPLNVDERVRFADHYGIEYCDTISEKTFDCPMPEDGQEILISTAWGVRADVACNDMDGEGFFCYGLENNGDWDGVDAWMLLPEPYKKGEEE